MTKVIQSICFGVKNFFVDMQLDLSLWRISGKRNWYDARKIPFLPIWFVTGKFSRRKGVTKVFFASSVPALEKQL